MGARRRGRESGALERCDIAPEEIQSAHVGNFAAELYCMQGHLGAFFTEVHPAFSGLPTGRHEAACASGSIALLAAGAEIEAVPSTEYPTPARRPACSVMDNSRYREWTGHALPKWQEGLDAYLEEEGWA